MKYGFLGLGLILAGMFGLVFIVAFESITINNESEYYTLKEAMEAAMIESVDWECFRLPISYGDVTINGCNGRLKISEQKFVENFTRRFATSISGDASKYSIEFYDIMEMPPKATIVVSGTTQKYQLSTQSKDISFDIKNNLSGILEGKDWMYYQNKSTGVDVGTILDTDGGVLQ